MKKLRYFQNIYERRCTLWLVSDNWRGISQWNTNKLDICLQKPESDQGPLILTLPSRSHLPSHAAP